MQYVSRHPAPPLGDFVDYVWLLSDAPPHPKERVLPSGTAELVVNLRDDEIRIYDALNPERYQRYSGAVVSGTYRGSFVIDARQHASIMGVHFKPGGAFPFLGAPLGELADLHVDLQTLWGRTAVALRARLCGATAPAERFRLMEEALANHAFRPLEHHAAVQTVLDGFGPGTGASVRETARQVGLSQRRFIQVFTAEVGLTPKRFGRVQRFRRALARVPKTLAPDWAQLAVECGYFDQSHLIHDFREFSGVSPTDYLRQRSDQVKDHHVPVTG